MRLRRSGGETKHPRIITDFNRTLLLVADPDSLQASVAVRFQELFGSERVLILQLDSRQLSFLPGFSLGFDPSDIGGLMLERRGALARWLLVNESVLKVDQQRDVVGCLDQAERSLLSRLQIRVCVPLLVLNRLTGIMLLGSKDDKWRLSEEQADLLQALAGQAGLAFENAALHREQRDRLRRLYRAERLAAAGQLAAGVAHEIRNPLTSIRSTIQYVLPSFGESDQKRGLLQELLSEVDRIDRIVNDLLTLTRPTDFHPIDMNLVELLDHTLLLIGPQARKQGVDIVYPREQGELNLRGDMAQLKQVLLNVLLNALQAMPEGGTLTVSVAGKGGDGTGLQVADVRITDTGAGIPPEHIDKVFDPFFTLKKEGTGLGLSISYSIIQQHDGDIEFQSEVGRGTTVIIRLPVSG
ncbi:MAG: GAF domain-containing protein [Acidobacteria bacterium]|nr:MAG: GAF domain-containing protein [Acidobacteriota bacterium]